MNNDFAIKVENLSKRYRIGLKEKRHDTFGGAVASWFKSPFSNWKQLRKLSSFSGNDGEDIIWALKDVSFEVNEGDVVGIIGRNGAGKSTLLKIISRITEPTSGEIICNGRVASLLEVGTGFHPELTGRENVYLNGTILGLTKKEIDQKFDEIVDFSGVGKFLDTPIKRYSSGMKVRLAFAVAAHLDPEILLVDEVLAVGDADFQKKCLGKMNSIASQGRTILFVSHNMMAIESLCNSTILLQHGKIAFYSDTASTVNYYLKQRTWKPQSFIDLRQHTGRNTVSAPIFQSIRLLNEQFKESATFRVGDKIIFDILLDSKNDTLKSPKILLVFLDEKNTHITHFDTQFMVKEKFEITRETLIRCHWNSCCLVPGVYSVVLKLVHDGKILDRIFDVINFEMRPANLYGTSKPNQAGGLIIPEGKWEFGLTNDGIGLIKG